MKNITIYTLEGCSACVDFKSLLRKNNIFFNEILCSISDRSYECEKKESLIGTTRYPFSKIDVHNATVYVCITLDSNKLGTVDKIDNSTLVYHVDSQINMLNTILKL